MVGEIRLGATKYTRIVHAGPFQLHGAEDKDGFRSGARVQ